MIKRWVGLIVTPDFLAQQVANAIAQQITMPLQFALNIAPLSHWKAATETVNRLMAIDPTFTH
jgi:hypothetical protein